MEPWKQELYHHGILGMRWGKRNGPPYPLSPGDHSASEKKAGWRKSLDKKNILDKNRNIIKIGAVVTAGALVWYGILKYKDLQKNKNVIESGLEFVEDLGSDSSKILQTIINNSNSFNTVAKSYSNMNSMFDGIDDYTSELIRKNWSKIG